MDNIINNCVRCKSETQNNNKHCQKCLTYFREKYQEKQIIQKSKTQLCNKCNLYKNLIENYEQKKNGNYFKMCNDCRKLESKKRETKKEKVLTSPDNQYCSNCSKEKPKSDFNIKNGRIMKTCKNCLTRKNKN